MSFQSTLEAIGIESAVVISTGSSFHRLEARGGEESGTLVSNNMQKYCR